VKWTSGSRRHPESLPSRDFRHSPRGRLPDNHWSMDVAAEDLIDEPFSFVEEALLGDPAQWLPGLTRDAAGRLLVQLGVHVSNAWVRRAVEVRLGPPTSLPGRLEMCIAWKAAEASGLYPELGGCSSWSPWGRGSAA
jgi:hypothetical protein